MKRMESDWYRKIWTLDIQNQSWVEDTLLGAGDPSDGFLKETVRRETVPEALTMRFSGV